MKPIKITVTGSDACVTEKPVLTSGMVGLPVEFIFDEAWNGLDKTAVFRAGSRSYPVSCVQDAAMVPWEVLERPNVGLYIGVLGADHRAVVKIPTVWVLVDTIAPGTGVPDTVPKEPTPQVYDQILSAANQAVATANAVRADADAGMFMGPAGPKGDAGVVEFVVVMELPTQDIKNAIYLVPAADGSDGNLFGEYVYINGAWERIGSACVEVNLDEYVKRTDYATDGTGGVIKAEDAGRCTKGVYISSEGMLALRQAKADEIDAKKHIYFPITPNNLDYAVKKGLADSKLADTENAWTDEEKAAARELLGAVGTKTADRTSVYAVNSKGEQILVGTCSNAANNGMIPIYSNSGTINVSTPGGNSHAANKGYVDSLIAELIVRIQALEDQLNAR